MNQKNYEKLFLAVFTSFLFGFSIYAWQKNEEPYSNVEKRNLTTHKSLQDTSILDHTYQKNYETLKNDQFPIRNHFMKLYTIFDQIMGNRKIDDVFIGKDALIQDYTKMSSKQMNQTTKAMKTFQANYPNISMNLMIAPTAIGISNQLPLGAPSNTQLQDIKDFYHKVSNVNHIDLIKPFLNSKEDLYYHSDHHWTSKGAKLAFDTYAKNLKLDTNKQAYEKLYVKNDFYGTLASKTGIYRYPDEIIAYQNKNKEDVYRITYSETKTIEYSLYDQSKLKKDTPYDFFLKGNHPMVHIETASISNKHLLVIKDSYANAFIPFLTPYYSSITVIDPRYYFDSLSTIMSEKGITDVLFLYNMSTLSQDTSLRDALQS